MGVLCTIGEGIKAQTAACTFRSPFYRMHFGTGSVPDANGVSLTSYARVSSSCPTDGHYSFTPATNACFRGDWHTLTEDHTPGDASGNMLLVNSAYNPGVVFSTRVKGFKGGKQYQFGVWLMNVCRPTDKCSFPLLPNLLIRLETRSGKTVARFSTSELTRQVTPRWTQHRAQFSVAANEPELILSFYNTAPGGCGNDFALDDITFQECVPITPAKLAQTKKQPPPTTKKQPSPVKKETKPAPKQAITVRQKPEVTVAKTETTPREGHPTPVLQRLSLLPSPPVMQQRANPVVARITTRVGEILLQLYDNGEIDGDTVSIYHNNRMIISAQRLSQKPITIRLRVDETQPHHELVMVANNLGSIPPNTSLMIVTTKEKRHQVFISSTEQKNAKVVIDLEKD